MATSSQVADDCRRENGPGATLPPTIIFVAGFLVALLAHSGSPLPIAGSSRDELRLPIGLFAVAVGVGLFAWALWVFAAARTGILLQRPARCVVDSGPYAWSRNPMYVAFVTAYVGIALLANTVWPVVILPVVIFMLQRQVIQREERYLVRTFGDDYLAYCRRVRRWV